MREDWRAEYMGGKGLAYRYLLGNLARGLDPLDPESEIVFMTGPLAGTLVPTSSRMAVALRSPISGGPGCGVVACGAAAELKFAGYDGIIVSGRASSPAFVYVADQRVTFERASLLWGKGTHETERTIQQKKWTYMARTLTIGPAGENLVPYSCTTADGRGQAGETAIGAVMGSKNLKAVVVRGQAAVHVADLEGFLGLVQGAWGDGSRGDWRIWSDIPSSPELSAVAGDAYAPDVAMPTPGQHHPAGPSVRTPMQTRLMLSSICASCPLGHSVPVANASGIAIGSAAYCTTGMQGMGLETGNADSLAQLSSLCDDLGLDTISTAAASTAAAIGFAVDDKQDASPDFESPSYDGEYMASAVRLLASGGSVGARQAVAAFSKGLLQAERGRVSASGDSAERLQDIAIRDSLILCNHWHPPLETVAAVLTTTTGSPSTVDDLREAGNRILDVEQLATDPGLRHR